MAFLATFILLLAFVTGVAWAIEPTVAILVTLGGTLVILESWFTALGFLHRHRLGSLRARWVIFLAALIPWLVGLGVAATLMLGLFLASDWVGS